MKRTILFLSFFSCIWGCKSASSVCSSVLLPIQPATCTNYTELHGAIFHDFDTFIVAKTFTSDNGSSSTIYFLDKPEADVPKLFYYACNLPDAYKQDKLRVRINGFKFVPIPNADYIGVPIELTSIEVTPKVN